MQTRKARRILVTGANGVLGTGFELTAAEFPDVDFVYSGSKVCDLTQLDEVRRHFDEVKPDAVLHLAAKSGGIELLTGHPASVLRDNLQMNLNVLEAARIGKIRKTVMTLSTGMYPDKVSYPIKEEYIHDGEPHSSVYSYAYAKRIVEPSIRAYRKEFEMDVIGLVPNGIFGENSNFKHGEATMLPSLIRRFYENREGDAPLTVWGDGSPLREYTYARDLARAYMWTVDNYSDAQILHVGTTEEVSVKDVALLIADELGIDKERIVFDASKPAGQFRKGTDNSKFVSLSGFRYTPFREGLHKTIKWFRENYPDKVRL